MADVSRIQGPSGPPDRGGIGRQARKPESNKFQDEMRRVDAVSKIDPDEAKKRKRPEETLREEELSRAAHAEPEKKTTSEGRAFKVPEGSSSEEVGGKSAPVEGKPETEEITPSKEAVPTKEEVTAKTKPAHAAEFEQTVHGLTSEVKQRSDTGQLIKSRQAEVAAGAAMPAAPETPEEEKVRSSKAADKTSLAVTATSMAPTVEPTKVEEPKPEEAILFPKEPPPAYTHLHPDILDIVERIVGALVYLDQTGIKETTIIINASEEKPSIFDGSKITIREYSTAPKQFNVELSGTPKAVDLFQTNMQDLEEAFDTLPYNFEVKNIQTSLK